MTPSHSPATSADWLPRWELFVLFVGDLTTLLLFAVWGEARHMLLQNSREPLRAVVNVAAPFMLAWLIVGAVVGTYRGTALFPLGRTIGKTLLAGLIAGSVGVAFWSLARGRWPAPAFFAVATGISTVMLLAWRMAWSRIRRAWWPELP